MLGLCGYRAGGFEDVGGTVDSNVRVSFDHAGEVSCVDSGATILVELVATLGAMSRDVAVLKAEASAASADEDSSVGVVGCGGGTVAANRARCQNPW